MLGWVGLRENEMSHAHTPKVQVMKTWEQSRGTQRHNDNHKRTTHCELDNKHQSWVAEDKEMEGLLHNLEQLWAWHEAVVKVDRRGKKTR